MKRPTKPLARKPFRRKLRRPPMDGELRTSVIERAQYRCDLCFKPLSVEHWECHHRQTRSRLGIDSMANLLALHGKCHMWVHNHPQWSDAHGFLVPSHHMPEVWRVHRHRTVWMNPGDQWTVAAPHPEQLEACADA